MISPDDILLGDQVAVVTGGASGIGAGIARALAAFGAHVTIADIDREAAQSTAGEIAALGREALAVPTDVMESEQIRAMVQRTREHFGRLDILINNAGGVRFCPFLEMSERSRQRHLQINLMNLFTATDAAVRVMIEGGRGGAIVNISSIEALRAAPNFAVYAACKAAMNNFTRSMALELSGHGIRVNALAPDYIETPGNRAFAGGDDAQRGEALRRYIPLGRGGDVDEVAGTAVFLASRLSSYITGQVLGVDGGTLAAGGWKRKEGNDWSL